MILPQKNTWKQIPYDEGAAQSLYNHFNISYHICVAIAQRGICSKQEAEQFLWPKLSHLDDPFKIPNVHDAANFLRNIIVNNSKVAIVCDYDVDGITSVTLLINVLKHFGISPDFFVPRRTCEGYGLSQEIIQRILKKKKYDVVITLDCGTNSVDEVEFLYKNNISVLIIDHHRSMSHPPSHCCIVNPHIIENDSTERYRSMCTVGLVFKVCCALLRVLRNDNDKRACNYSIKNDLDLVTLGTIADMANLVHDNRIMCKFGLKLLSGKMRRPGIEALCQTADLPNGINIQQQDISFKLCPRLNACGRLSDAVLPITMLLSENFDDAITRAYELDETNKERQVIEREITEQAEKMVRSIYSNDPGIVLYNKNWHTGVVGIISGKFTRDFNKPCVVLGHERGIAKGSGRSANGTNLIDVLNECTEFLDNWGGHPYAVGISLSVKNIDDFRRAFNDAILRHQESVINKQEILYSSEITLEEINKGFFEEFELLQPFGQQNPEPRFLLKNVVINSLPETFGVKKNHVKFFLTDKYSKKIIVLGWNFAKNIPPIRTPIDIIVSIKRESCGRNLSIGLSMIDWRISSKETTIAPINYIAKSCFITKRRIKNSSCE